MFNRYYQSELTYLRELGRAFAEEHPDLSALFADRGDDPDVDRLLEGFAFLTARIRERVEDAVPELVDALSELLLPHYARTMPAATVVEFTPNANALRSRFPVKAGTSVASSPIRGTSCLFRTTRDIELLPLATVAARLDKTASREPELELSFATLDDGTGPVFTEGGVELFLGGQLAQSSMLLLWFMRHVKSVGYRGADGRPFDLVRARVSAPGLDGSRALVPWPNLSPPGSQLLQAYFNLPQALLFVRLCGLEDVPADRASREFSLIFRFNNPPPLPERVDATQFRPNCVPVINLFDTDGDPIKRDPLVQEHLIRPAGIDPRHSTVYSVNRVVGIRGQKRDRLRYEPFFGFAHVGGDGEAFYTSRRCQSPVDGGLDWYLSVSQPRETRPTTIDETLSLELTCTNRWLTTDLNVGDVCIPTRSSPAIAKFRNITHVSVPVQPQLGTELQWRLLSHLALNHRTLGDVGTLRALLLLYNFHPEQQQQGRANKNRCEALRSVTIEPTARVIRGAVVRGVRTAIAVDETRFAGAGDVFLLGCVIDGLIGAQVPMNSFNQLDLALHPSEARIEWPPKNGQQALV